MESEIADEVAVGAGGLGMVLESSEGNVLELGDFKQENVTLMLMDLNHVNEAFKLMGLEQIDGILGADFLKDNEAVIDFKNDLIYIKGR